MDKKEKAKQGKKTEEKVADDGASQPVCEKPFAPETARAEDKDEPCNDGVD
jgi:hypothetical protein